MPPDPETVMVNVLNRPDSDAPEFDAYQIRALSQPPLLGTRTCFALR